MKNKHQIKKKTFCHKDSFKPIKIVFYKDRQKSLEKLLTKINGNVLILGRNNIDKDNFNVIENKNIRFLTVHKSKGLEEDNVIIINLYNSRLGFPSLIKNHQILNKILTNDYIIHEEERRLFYVALTRSKNNVYLLTPVNNYSVFIRELIWNYQEKIEIINID